jgi:hypothetical protein
LARLVSFVCHSALLVSSVPVVKEVARQHLATSRRWPPAALPDGFGVFLGSSRSCALSMKQFSQSSVSACASARRAQNAWSASSNSSTTHRFSLSGSSVDMLNSRRVCAPLSDSWCGAACCRMVARVPTTVSAGASNCFSGFVMDVSFVSVMMYVFSADRVANFTTKTLASSTLLMACSRLSFVTTGGAF